MKKIGDLKTVDLREVWSNEAYDFTKWLNDNLELLGEKLGLTLGESETETKLENSYFHIDITTSTEDGASVIIENQLEKTDHKHLGQILTYLVGMDSKVAIWITKNPRPEHIKVIDWLNEQTDRDFYLVKVEAYKIDESQPAPFFHVISEPSMEAKQIGQEKKEMGERDKLKYKFWETLLEKSEKKTDIFSNARPHTWTVMIERAKEVQGLSFGYYINKSNSHIALCFKEELKPIIMSLKEELEKAIGMNFEHITVASVDKPCHNRFKATFEIGGWNDQEKWSDMQEQMIEKIILLEEAIKPHYHKLNNLKAVA